jgi:hypothetical protein
VGGGVKVSVGVSDGSVAIAADVSVTVNGVDGIHVGDGTVGDAGARPVKPPSARDREKTPRMIPMEARAINRPVTI